MLYLKPLLFVFAKEESAANEIPCVGRPVVGKDGLEGPLFEESAVG